MARCGFGFGFRFGLFGELGGFDGFGGVGVPAVVFDLFLSGTLHEVEQVLDFFEVPFLQKTIGFINHQEFQSSAEALDPPPSLTHDLPQSSWCSDNQIRTTLLLELSDLFL